MNELTNSSPGRWSVETVPGTSYLLDLDSKVIWLSSKTHAGFITGGANAALLPRRAAQSAFSEKCP